jgi:hypothetical protein
LQVGGALTVLPNGILNRSVGYNFWEISLNLRDYLTLSHCPASGWQNIAVRAAARTAIGI